MRLRKRHVAWLFWSLFVLFWLGLVFIPTSTRLTRGLSALTLLLLWLSFIVLVWRWKLVRWMTLTATAAVIVFLALPTPRTTDVHALREEYVNALVRYEGVPYVVGGESLRGIDCSGLIRRGLIDSAFSRGVTTLDPGLTRGAIALWWEDCSARALGEWQRNITEHLFDAESINAIDHRHILPGDIAVTQNGVQVLAYIGNKQWIEADPDRGKVITVPVPTKGNRWFEQPVRVFRWRVLRGR